MSRTISVVTGSRAEYGLLQGVIQSIEKSRLLSLQLIVTGMHLSPDFGLTYKEIESDGHTIDYKVDSFVGSDTAFEITKSIGKGLSGFAEVWSTTKPDVVLMLGDRYEILPAAIAAIIAGIPVAHLHGGETSEGAFDESIRHAITKLAHLHFVAAESYRNRVLQMGEQPDRVHLVGGLGVDRIKSLKLMGRRELESQLGQEFLERNLLVTFHPVTLEIDQAENQLNELLKSMAKLKNTLLIFTLANADTKGSTLNKIINRFVEEHSNMLVFPSLGQLRYLSCLQFVDAVVGNSSSGLAEVPTFRKGTINVGDRQRGRLRADSVIDCAPTSSAIDAAIEQLYSDEFQNNLMSVTNPYGEGGAREKIIEVLENVSIEGLSMKRFYDIAS